MGNARHHAALQWFGAAAPGHQAIGSSSQQPCAGQQVFRVTGCQPAEHIGPAIGAAQHGAKAALAIGKAIDGTNDSAGFFRLRDDGVGETRTGAWFGIGVGFIATASANEDDHAGRLFVLRISART